MSERGSVEGQLATLDISKLVWVVECALGRGDCSCVWFLPRAVYGEKPVYTWEN